MKPVLYERVQYCATQIKPVFTGKGLGTLSDALSCTEYSKINAEFELEMKYPASGIHAAEIQIMRILYTTQPFFIYKINKQLDGTIDVFARHVSYMLSFIPVMPFKIEGALPAAFWQAMVTSGGMQNVFAFSSDITQTGGIDMFSSSIGPSTIREMMLGTNGMSALYGGEWVCDGFDVKLVKNKGAVKPYTIKYGINLIDAKQEENLENIVTHIIPYGFLNEGRNETWWCMDKDDQINQLESSWHRATKYITHYDAITGNPGIYLYTAGDAQINVDKGGVKEAGIKEVLPLPGAGNMPFVRVKAVNVLEECKKDPKDFFKLDVRFKSESSTRYVLAKTKNTATGQENYTVVTLSSYTTNAYLAGYKLRRQKLKEVANQYIAQHPVSIPISIKLKSIPEGMDDIRLGDTVRVKVEKYGINVAAKITEMEYDTLRERVTSFSVGNGQVSSLAGTLMQQGEGMRQLNNMAKHNAGWGTDLQSNQAPIPES